MISFLTDEDLRGAIIDGLRIHHPDVDLVRAVDVGLGATHDDLLLAWAAENGRVLVTQDVNTMTHAANRRVAASESMSGLIVARDSLPLAIVIADLAFIAAEGNEGEFENATLWLPL
jgi:hypothetical protein